jgi:glycosyl transferase family 2
MEIMRVHCGLMTQNEQKDLVQNVTSIIPYVDTVTIVDGGSVGDTITYFRNWSQEEPKIRFFIHPWQDNFPAQRNNYLNHINEIAEPGDWILCFDPDEFIADHSLKSLRSAIELAESNNKNMIGFRCRSVSLKGEKVVWSNIDEYYKRFLMKWNPLMRYAAHGGQVHEYIAGVQQSIWDPPGEAMLYEHRKQENDIWRKGLRNMWIGGGGPNGQHAHLDEWKQLRSMCTALGIDNWAQMYNYLLKGNISQEIKDWMIAHRQDNWGDGSSEFREAYKTYFRLLHPEEEPQELRGEHIP